ncbi:MAG: SDR family NAD(P)-dependent oxidoreductase [Hyphomicrobiaceae bacterium]
MDLRLKEKVAVVSGASRGIGRAIVEVLADEGMRIVANHFGDDEAVEYLSQSLRASSKEIEIHAGDVGDQCYGEQLVNFALSSFGRLDVLVHNAGITTRQSLLDTPFSDFERVMRTNLHGAYHLATAAARQMRRSGTGGSLIGISSLHGQLAKADMGAYCITKAGIDMMFKQLAVELAPFGIRANTIAPGTIDTGMNPIYHATDPLGAARRERLMDRVPMKKLGEPVDIARLVAFVASPMSAYTTGAVIYADGGYTADGTPR